MRNNPQQPGEYDAVLGGNNSLSIENAAVLGGIEGVRLRLKNIDENVRVSAINEALNYGNQGLDLVIKCLKDKSVQVQIQAYYLLTARTEIKAKRALLKFNPEGLKLEQIEIVTVNRFGKIIQRQQRLVRYFIEDLGNGVTLKMAAIPGGSFMMGSPENEVGRNFDESPQHEVNVRSFFMGRYQVTQSQYQAIIGNNPSNFKFKGYNCPVETVSLGDAVTFCKRLTQKTGKHYQLPSEEQWEYACRAGTTTPFYFGESITTKLVNYNYSNGQGGYHKDYYHPTKNVGTFPPNAFGLYDMHGNVSEWCRSIYGFYTDAPIKEDNWISQNGEDYKSYVSEFKQRRDWASENRRVVVRGGSYGVIPAGCRSAFRSHASMNFGYASGHIGFRIVCSDFVKMKIW
ncbi:formylglycine-generating enzyme family protein [Anabaena sp. WFMT]|uniref:formylglycine-generating enzyme family protein n=1 Tax=Anabaena sp. WFMT TaxID=3449730 RepID=UPI003F277FEF